MRRQGGEPGSSLSPVPRWKKLRDRALRVRAVGGKEGLGCGEQEGFGPGRIIWTVEREKNGLEL